MLLPVLRRVACEVGFLFGRGFSFGKVLTMDICAIGDFLSGAINDPGFWTEEVLAWFGTHSLGWENGSTARNKVAS